MGKKIVVTGGKGGVGKTTVTANLGAKLSRAGCRVALMDLDLGLNNLDVACGIESRIVYDIIDVIEGRCRCTQALVEVERYPNLSVLPSAHGLEKSDVNGQNVRIVADKLAAICDYVLIDCPAGVEAGFHRAVSAASEAYVVTTPHISSVRDADKVIQLLKTYRLTSVALILNRARGDLILGGDMISAEDVGSLLKLPVLGVIPEDDGVPLAAAEGVMVRSNCPADTAFNMLADNILEGTGEVYDATEHYRGFLGSLRRSLRRKV